jgi:hypothetical protein
MDYPMSDPKIGVIDRSRYRHRTEGCGLRRNQRQLSKLVLRTSNTSSSRFSGFCVVYPSSVSFCKGIYFWTFAITCIAATNVLGRYDLGFAQECGTEGAEILLDFVVPWSLLLAILLGIEQPRHSRRRPSNRG